MYRTVFFPGGFLFWLCLRITCEAPGSATHGPTHGTHLERCRVRALNWSMEMESTSCSSGLLPTAHWLTAAIASSAWYEGTQPGSTNSCGHKLLLSGKPSSTRRQVASQITLGAPVYLGLVVLIGKKKKKNCYCYCATVIQLNHSNFRESPRSQKFTHLDSCISFTL